MGVRIKSELQIPRPPTDVCIFGDRIYTATKGKRVFFTSLELEGKKSILFSSQVNALSSSDGILYCGCQDGLLYGLSKAHKTVLKTPVDPKGITRVFWDEARGDIFVASNGKRVVQMGDNGIIKNTFYGYDSPVLDIDVSSNGTLFSVSQNNQSIKLVDINAKEPKHIYLSSGFPETVKVISNKYVVLCTLDGILYLYDAKGLGVVSTLNVSAGICSIHLHLDCFVLLGLIDGTIALYKHLGTILDFVEMIKVPGIPVGFTSHGKDLVVITSREMRMGRWNKKSDGKNMVIVFEID
ncbi:hypothetical protein PAEPH01_1900 [Pancytospora epiphaga]|nr:hypothetical protein PAEPH01_1900 [Pancytospora epiphaga]